MLKKYYLGEFFWVPILHKRYQNMSGFAGDYGSVIQIKFNISDLEERFVSLVRYVSSI